MYFNEFELDVLSRHRIDDLRRLAQPMGQPASVRFLRIGAARTLVALANLVWRDEVAPAKPAAGKVALS